MSVLFIIKFFLVAHKFSKKSLCSGVARVPCKEANEGFEKVHGNDIEPSSLSFPLDFSDAKNLFLHSMKKHFR